MNELTSYSPIAVAAYHGYAGVKSKKTYDASVAGQPITSLRIGGSGVVVEIKVPVAQRGRILEMGLLVGTKVQLVRFAPLGDPVEIKLRGYHLTLRRHEADQIRVKTTADCGFQPHAAPTEHRD